MSAFRPGLLPTLVVLALLPVLIGLGLWQLSRAEEKRQLLVAHQQRQAEAPVSLDEMLRRRAPSATRVRLSGRFDTRHALLLDSRVNAGRVGVEVLQPFHDRLSGRWVLLNRGWLAWPDRRQRPRFDTPDGELRLSASVYRPTGEPLALQAEPPAAGWPRLVGRVDADALWRQLARDGVPLELRLEPGPASFAVDWPVVAMLPAKHVGYAIQWFAMAAALVVLFIHFGLYHARERRHAPHHRPA